MLRKQPKTKYKELSEEKKYVKREYEKIRYHNISGERNQGIK